MTSDTGTPRRPEPPSRAEFEELFRLMSGYRVWQALYVVARLGIADLLEGGSRDSDELAQMTGVHAGALYRVLRFHSGVGLFRSAVRPRAAGHYPPGLPDHAGHALRST